MYKGLTQNLQAAIASGKNPDVVQMGWSYLNYAAENFKYTDLNSMLAKEVPGDKDFLTKTQSEPFVKVLMSQKIPVTEVFYPDTKEFLVHEYQFMMSKAASQETFNKTITFINHYSSSSEK